MLSLVLALPSCEPDAWTSPEQCEELDAGARQDDCWATVAPGVFRRDRTEGERLVTTRIQDPLVRDYVWLTVTREVDPGSYRWCDRIQEDAIAERCRVLVSRPHLHRELVGPGHDGGNGPMGPPPGGPMPPREPNPTTVPPPTPPP